MIWKRPFGSRMTPRGRKKCRILLFFGCCFLFIFIITIGRTGCSGKDCHQSNGPFIRRFPSRVWRNTTHKTILRWTGFFTDASWEDTDDRYFQRCKVKTCKMTNDKERLDDVDAVLFHVGAVWNFWRGVTMPSRRYPHQVWILQNVEPPPRSPLNFDKLAGVFNWTAWYRLDSDVPVTYGGLRKFLPGEKLKYVNSSQNFARENPRLAAWMSSNCVDFGQRLRIINEVKKYLPMDLYGKCGTRRCPETICRDVISDYKFFFTLENCWCKDYVTEKFWEALRRQQVPVVWGGAKYKEIAPPHSFVDITDFPSLKSLAEYLIKVGQDEAEYNKYLEWTKMYDVYGEVPARRLFWCDLCEALHDTSRPAQVYEDLGGWVRDEPESCPQWTLGNQIGRLLAGFRITWGL